MLTETFLSYESTQYPSQIVAFPFTSLLNQVSDKSFVSMDVSQAFATHLPGNPAAFKW